MKLLLALTFVFNTFASVSYLELQDVKQALFEAFEVLKENPSDTLKINKPIPGLSETYWWDIDMVHASYVKVETDGTTEHNLYLMGGFVRLADMTPEGLLVTGCHEMGHGIGGTPHKESGSSTEGQSDYFATAKCLPIALKFLKARTEFTTKDVYKKLCERQGSFEIGECERMMFALESDISYFKTLGDLVSFDVFSTHVQHDLNTSPSYYPDSQCRLDTMINGIMGLERPECWFPGGERNGKDRD